jgi:hypothetical protein
MDVSAHREWMYNRVLPDGVGLKNTFYEGVEIFILHACQLDQFKNEGTIRCPCLICDCLNSEIPDEVRDHLYKKGFNLAEQQDNKGAKLLKRKKRMQLICMYF